MLLLVLLNIILEVPARIIGPENEMKDLEWKGRSKTIFKDIMILYVGKES